jgi:hypothetical protein
VIRRECAFRSQTGQPCRAAPLKDGQFCRMHSPEHAEEVREARRLGGLRRKREVTVSGAYDFDGLETVAGIRRLLEVAVLDTLGQENSLSRSRTLAYLAQVALRTFEVGEMEQRVAILEQAVRGTRIEQSKSPFEAIPESFGEEDTQKQ